MMLLPALVLVLVGLGGTAVVLTRDPRSQVIVLSLYGLLLALMFFVFRAPDVALSQVTVGILVLPMMVLLGLARIRRNEREMQERREKSSGRRRERRA